MRADRLVAALLLMQARGRVTAAELADELEVSVATARRDLEALSTAGVPVYPQPGRGGGWSLVGGARTDLSGLTADRGPGAVPPRRPGGGRRPGGQVGAAQAGAGPARHVPGRRRGRGRRRRDRPGAAGASATGSGPSWSRCCRPPSSAGARSASGTPIGPVQRTRAAGRPAGPGRQGRRLVPDRRHRARAAHVPRRPDHRRRRDRPRRRAAGRLRAVGGVGPGGRRGGAAALAAVGDACSSTARFAAGPAQPVRPALPRRAANSTTDASGSGWRRRRRWTSPEQLAGWGALVEVVEPESVQAELARIGSELTSRYGN